MTTANQVDGPYGNPSSAAQKYSRASHPGGGSRPYLQVRVNDIQALITSYDRKTLLSVSRNLSENYGPFKSLCKLMKNLVVGTAFQPSSDSTDAEFRAEAERVIRDQFLAYGAYAGGGRTVMSMIAEIPDILMRDGEVFILLTEFETGFPAIQIIPAHRIGSRAWKDDTIIKDGPYKSKRCIDGIVISDTGRTIGYNFLDDDPLLDRVIPVESMIHEFSNDYPEGLRGLPMLSHGLNACRDVMTSGEWEQINLLFRSSVMAIENSADGIATGTHPGNYFDESSGASDSSTAEPACEQRTTAERVNSPARILNFKAGSGQKIELLKHDNPGPIYESFCNRLFAEVCAGIPIPISMVPGGNSGSKGGGTAERRDIEIMRRTILMMQAKITPSVKRIFGYATAKLMKNGAIPQSPDWWKWSFSRPSTFSIDQGRDLQALLDLHARGVIDDGHILQTLGFEGDEEDYWTMKFTRAAEKELIFQKIQKDFNVTLDARIKGVLNPNEPSPAQIEATSAKTNQPATTPKP